MNRDPAEPRLVARRKILRTVLVGAAATLGGALLASQTVQAMDDGDCKAKHPKKKHRKHAKG